MNFVLFFWRPAIYVTSLSYCFMLLANKLMMMIFVLTNQTLLTQHILLNQLIFAEAANFCLLSYLLLSHRQAF